MRKQIAFTGVLFAVLILTIVLNACGGQQRSDIVGTWERVTPMKDVTLGFLFVEEIEFLQDGTWILPKFGGASGTYSFPESDRIKIESKEGSHILRFTLSGDTLTFYDGEKAIVFRRKK